MRYSVVILNNFAVVNRHTHTYHFIEIQIDLTQTHLHLVNCMQVFFDTTHTYLILILLFDSRALSVALLKHDGSKKKDGGLALQQKKGTRVQLYSIHIIKYINGFA